MGNADLTENESMGLNDDGVGGEVAIALARQSAENGNCLLVVLVSPVDESQLPAGIDKDAAAARC